MAFQRLERFSPFVSNAWTTDLESVRWFDDDERSGHQDPSANPDHHRINNNGTRFVHCTRYPTPVTSARVRLARTPGLFRTSYLSRWFRRG